MKPIHLICEASLNGGTDIVFSGMQDVSQWSSFVGYGPLPGIKKAEYERRTDDMIGSIIRVQNTDGSSHTETIREWAPGQSIVMEFGSFTPPLAHLASKFVERWSFARSGNVTLARREFELYPRSPLTYAPLWMISKFLKRGMAQHLQLIAASSANA